MKSLHIPIGATAPDFPLSPGDMTGLRLSSLRGAPVILLFYRGHWCQSCRRQLSQVASVYETIRALDSELVAVSADTRESTREAAEARAWPFPLVSDPGLTIIDRYGLRDDADQAGRRIARPATFILDADGIVRFCHVGVDRQDRPAIGAILLALESLSGARVV